MPKTVTVHGVEIDHPGANHVTIQRGGKAYLDVEGRLKMLRSLLGQLGASTLDYEIFSEAFPTCAPHLAGMKVSVIVHFPHPITGVWVRRQYDGIAQSNLTATQLTSDGRTLPAVQATSPYEVAQTSAAGRGLGFAAIDLAGVIESAAGMAKAGVTSDEAATPSSSGGSRFVAPAPNAPDGAGYVCEVCEEPIAPSRDGKYSAAQRAGYSLKDTGRILCFTHKSEAVAAAASAQG